MRLFSLLAVALILSVALIACNSSDLTRNIRTAASSPTPGTQTPPSDGARRITPVELRDALAKGEAVVYDVRSEMAYKEGHIKGAHLLPLTEVVSKAGELPRDKLIVTYCS
jgi:3-mercaptopyruvate sulfurtransferase SseA